MLNRRNRKYRRYQAQKALSRLDLGLELTFLDAIDKDVILSDIFFVFDEECAYAIIVGPAPLKETLKAPADIAASKTSLKPGISFARYGWCNRSCIAVARRSKLSVTNAATNRDERPILKTASEKLTESGSTLRAF